MLLSGLGGATALLVGWGAMPPRSRVGSASAWALVGGHVALNGWIKIDADSHVILAMNRSEMGQGVHTALAQLVAEELNVPLQQVRLEQAGYQSFYGNVAAIVSSLPLGPRSTEPGQETRPARLSRWLVAKVARELGINLTGGSSSVSDAWEPLRWAAATARQQLLVAASLRWKLPLAELKLEAGVVSHASGPHATLGELAREAAATPPGEVRLKPAAQWQLLGRPAARSDLQAKVNGTARFGIDVRQPGQLFAALRHSPILGGSPGVIPVNALLQMPGVLRVVQLGTLAGSDAAVAVVAQNSWQALRAVQSLDMAWQQRPAGALDTAVIAADLAAKARQAAQSGFVFQSQGDAALALATAPRKVEALYEAPYLAHATMEPMNCTAQVKDGHVTLWVGTQVPGLARAAAARVAGVPEDAVTLHQTYLGGGFGRRLDVDHVAQAVRVAMDTGGVPVQLLWSREEDMTHDFYRPAGAAFLQAGLDAQGQAVAWLAGSAGDAIQPRWMERVLPALAGPIDTPDKTASEGLFDHPYAIPHQRIAHQATRSGVPIGNWRSVGHSHNAFFTESFVDELAHAAGADPLAYRLGLLVGLPRHAAVLKRAAEAAGWGTPLPQGVARGLALHESFGSINAQVMEVSSQDGRPRVLRVVSVLDCGQVVNPGIVAQQLESAVIFGLSAALFGRIDIQGGVVQQRSFPDYPLLTMAQTPRIETHLLPSELPPTGVGEPGVPPVAPALANAWFALTGERLRRLPLSAGK
nr:molybdopterin cofactor-binding domain-containing protein [Roseateles koreensis]